MMTKEDKHRAFDYCMYMMIASCFKKSICRHKVKETKLFLQYRELPFLANAMFAVLLLVVDLTKARRGKYVTDNRIRQYSGE